jgi:hypothetical protein
MSDMFPPSGIVTGETLHRGIKMALDSGEAATLADAEALFHGYRIGVLLGDDIRESATHQAALLTIVNTARRGFLGGVHVAGNRGLFDTPLLVRWGNCRTVGDAVRDLHGKICRELPGDVPVIAVGMPSAMQYAQRAFAVRTTFDGWSGGVVPLSRNEWLPQEQEFTPAGVLAGSLAVSEAFQFVRGGNPAVGRRDVGLSLWCPESTCSWLSADAKGPELELLPAAAWLVGLGHLGQAYLWTLGLLPYATPEDVTLVLQDFDTIAPANDSTSPLTAVEMIGQKKTRTMASWAEQRGFTTRIVERRFAADFRVAADEPKLALVGVDNADARASVEDAGFGCVVEAGLGKTNNEYLAFQMHRFPGPQSARLRWGSSAVQELGSSEIVAQPAYQALAASGLDGCGLTLLAGRSVGAPFVGTAVSTLVVAEVLRLLTGDRQYGLIDGTLRSVSHRQVLPFADANVAFNPGYTRALVAIAPKSSPGAIRGGI